MRWFWKFNRFTVATANKDDPTPFLGNTVIGAIKQAKDNRIIQIRQLAANYRKADPSSSSRDNGGQPGPRLFNGL